MDVLIFHVIYNCNQDLRFSHGFYCRNPFFYYRLSVMQKVNKGVKKIIIIASLVIILPLLVWYAVIAINRYKTKCMIQEMKFHKILAQGSIKLLKIWQEGDIDNLWERGKINCKKFLGEYQGVPASYLRCNPDFLACFFEHKKIEVVYQKRKYSISAVRKFRKKGEVKKIGGRSFYSIITRSNTDGVEIPNYAVMVELKLDQFHKSLPVLLEDSCNNVFLPQRIYAYGPYDSDPESEDWRFDNFGQLIYIDKFLVTFRDLFDWYQYDDKATVKLDKFPKDIELWKYPAIGLTISQMKDYCNFLGKQLMQAHLFDAATFLPGDYKNPRPKYTLRGPYPWSRRKKKEFLFKARLTKNYPHKKSYCMKVFTKECLKKMKYPAREAGSNSWAGIFQVLGGYLEFFHNPLRPYENLKVSSFYLPISSIHHELGKRVDWDGEDFKEKNVKMDDNYDLAMTEQNLKIGFRCMKYAYDWE